MDGKSVQGQSIEEVVKLIRGEDGTEVRLTLKRGNETKDIKVKRRIIRVNP